MRFSTFGVGSRFAWCALAVLPAWACATAVDNPVGGEALDTVGASGGDFPASGGASGSATAGTFNNSSGASTGGTFGAAGSNSAFGGGAGMAVGGHGGASGQGGGVTAFGGTTAFGGMTGAAGKGGGGAGGTLGAAGTSSGGSAGKASGGAGGGAGGVTGSAGKGGTGSAGKGGSGGSTSTGGATGGSTCDAGHSVATIATGTVYTGKATDCVRLSVNTGWSTVKIEFQPMPTTQSYPISYSYSSCAGNGTGTLISDYAESVMISGTNPGCDVFVQFTGGSTTLKVTYYD